MLPGLRSVPGHSHTRHLVLCGRKPPSTCELGQKHTQLSKSCTEKIKIIMIWLTSSAKQVDRRGGRYPRRNHTFWCCVLALARVCLTLNLSVYLSLGHITGGRLQTLTLPPTLTLTLAPNPNPNHNPSISGMGSMVSYPSVNISQLSVVSNPRSRDRMARDWMLHAWRV